MASLEIKTADEFAALDLEGRWKTRRAARETAVSRRILQIFVDRGGPIRVEELVATFPDEPGGASSVCEEVISNPTASSISRIAAAWSRAIARSLSP